MRTPLPPLPGLLAYEATARLGSIAAAADELGLSASAVSQRIRVLETRLGIALFERQARSIRLTPMGQAYLPTVRGAFEDLSAGTTGLFGPAGRGRLTVRVQVSYAMTWLVPRLQHFHDDYPHIDLRVVTSIWANEVPPHEVDLEIRHGNGRWAGFTADLLHEDQAVVVGSPAHLEAYGPLTGPADLEHRPRVHVIGYEDLWPRLFRTLRRPRGARSRPSRSTPPWPRPSSPRPVCTSPWSPNASPAPPSATDGSPSSTTAWCRCVSPTICSSARGTPI